MKRIQILAVIAALLTVVMAYFFLGHLKKQAEVPKISVVESSVDIKAGTEITAEMVVMAELPQDAVTPNSVTEISAAVGKIANSDIYTGQQIISPQLAEPGVSTNELSYIIEQGRKAATISVDAVSSVAGLVEPGNKVDVIVVYDETAESAVVLENISVLSVGKRMKSGSSASPEDVYETITLSLTANETLKLRQAEAKGEISLALRSYEDK